MLAEQASCSSENVKGPAHPNVSKHIFSLNISHAGIFGFIMRHAARIYDKSRLHGISF